MSYAEQMRRAADEKVAGWPSLSPAEVYVFRLNAGGAVLDDGNTQTQFPDWRAAKAEAKARGLKVPDGVPPLLSDVLGQH